MQQVPVKVTGSKLTADEFSDGTSQENQNQVTNSGQVLTASNLNQLTQSTNRIGNNAISYTDVTGIVSNNYELNQLTEFVNIAITAYFQGFNVFFTVDNANTGNVTLNVNGLGATPLLNPDSSQIPASGLIEDVTYYAQYVGTDFILATVNSTDVAFQASLANETASTEGDRLVGHTGETVFQAIEDRPTSATLAADTGATLVGSDTFSSSETVQAGLNRALTMEIAFSCIFNPKTAAITKQFNITNAVIETDTGVTSIIRLNFTNTVTETYIVGYTFEENDDVDVYLSAQHFVNTLTTGSCKITLNGKSNANTVPDLIHMWGWRFNT